MFHPVPTALEWLRPFSFPENPEKFILKTALKGRLESGQTRAKN